MPRLDFVYEMSLCDLSYCAQCVRRNLTYQILSSCVACSLHQIHPHTVEHSLYLSVTLLQDLYPFPNLFLNLPPNLHPLNQTIKKFLKKFLDIQEKHGKVYLSLETETKSINLIVGAALNAD